MYILCWHAHTCLSLSVKEPCLRHVLMHAIREDRVQKTHDRQCIADVLVLQSNDSCLMSVMRRLPQTLTDGKKSLSRYHFSPLVCRKDVHKIRGLF